MVLPGLVAFNVANGQRWKVEGVEREGYRGCGILCVGAEGRRICSERGRTDVEARRRARERETDGCGIAMGSSRRREDVEAERQDKKAYAKMSGRGWTWQIPQRGLCFRCWAKATQSAQPKQRDRQFDNGGGTEQRQRQR